MTMSIARIRTPNDPPDAAWNYKGHTYVGFGEYHDCDGNGFLDKHCEQCTTQDRTPATLNEDIKNQIFSGPLWPDENDEDGEWLPEDNPDARCEILEYDTEADSDVESMNISQCDDSDTGSADTNFSTLNALHELHGPPLPRHLPHGTIHKGFLHTRRQELQFLAEPFLSKQACGSYRLPLEHIAAPSCQSIQGINGHVLSVAEMKGCRNHRFLLAKPMHWQADESDSIFEYGSLFVLSGESNGSYISPVDPYVYPPRYSADRVNCCNLYVNSGCNVCELRYKGT
jgi:hypothetical protein